MIFLACVPRVLAPHLGNRDVRLVDDHEKVRRKVVEQREGAFAGLTPVEVSGVVLDARTDARLFQHLEVVLSARTQSLCLEQLAFGLEQRQLLLEFDLNRAARALQRGRGWWRSATPRTA